MMKINVVHCLFEQSGTFKNVFKSLGVPAYDYDLFNDFGETDFSNDLFLEIERAYKGECSLFDLFDKDDLLFAFFPCVRFEAQIIMCIKGVSKYSERLTPSQLVDRSSGYIADVQRFYDLFCKMFVVAYRKGLRLIVENPYTTQGFLFRYFPIKPTLIDYDRSKLGDKFVKPTQYWFVNCSPKNNFVFGEDCAFGGDLSKVTECSTVERSMITPEYARNFIKSFILDIDNA